MRASRLLSLLMLLQTRGKLTAEQLAEELEVSVRTVYRDIESLSAAGVPVYSDRGPAGGYQLLGGYRTRLTGLTADEAESLFLAGTPGAAAELGLGSVLTAAQLKLMAALPPELRDRAGRVRQRFHLDAPGWFKDIESPRYLEPVADAVWNQRVISVRYERWGRQVVTRRLEPYGLVLKAGTWYLVAASEGSPRTYRMARVQAIDVLAESFTRPDDFDLAAYWSNWNEEYGERLYRERAVVRLSPFAYDLLAFYQGGFVARAARESASEPDEEGWVTAALPIESIRHATHEFLRLGTQVEVLEPVELRTRIAEEAAAVVERYAGTGQPRVQKGQT
ncbi:helix-turn-helix transcriptional regulator [Flindersiella endophytica]